MRKFFVLLVPVLFLVGCGNKKELTFSKYAREYYDTYMKMVDNVDSATISLDDLYNASDESGYDLRSLKKCDRSSKITFFLDKSTKMIKNEKIELKC